MSAGLHLDTFFIPVELLPDGSPDPARLPILLRDKALCTDTGPDGQLGVTVAVEHAAQLRSYWSDAMVKLFLVPEHTQAEIVQILQKENLEEGLAEPHPVFLSVQSAKYGLAWQYHRRLDFKQARALAHSAHKAMKLRYGPDHGGTVITMDLVALCLQCAGQHGAAATIYKQVADKCRALPHLRDGLADALCQYGVCLHHTDRHKEALPVLQEAYKLRTKGGDFTSATSRAAGMNLAECLTALKQPAKAVSVYQHVLQGYKQAAGEDCMCIVSTCLEGCARAYMAMGIWDRALAMFAEAKVFHAELLKQFSMLPDHAMLRQATTFLDEEECRMRLAQQKSKPLARRK